MRSGGVFSQWRPKGVHARVLNCVRGAGDRRSALCTSLGQIQSWGEAAVLKNKNKSFQLAAFPPAASNWKQETPAAADPLSSRGNLQKQGSAQDPNAQLVTGQHTLPPPLFYPETSKSSRGFDVYLRGFVVAACSRDALRLSGPLTLQVGSDDRVQGQGPADGGSGWTSCRSVRFREQRGPISDAHPFYI